VLCGCGDDFEATTCTEVRRAKCSCAREGGTTHTRAGNTDATNCSPLLLMARGSMYIAGARMASRLATTVAPTGRPWRLTAARCYQRPFVSSAATSAMRPRFAADVCLGALPMRSSSSCVRLLSTTPTSDKEPAPEKKPSRWEQIKTTFREHGPVFLAFYATPWLGGFGVCWAGVTVTGVDGVALLQWLGADAVIDTTALSPQLINALIAAELNELGEFVRLPLVIATTPALSRRLRGMRSSSAGGGNDDSESSSSKK
jgi:hypothetical protein